MAVTPRRGYRFKGMRGQSASVLVASSVAFLLAACGPSGSGSATNSSGSTPSPSSTAVVTATPSQGPSPKAADLRLVIQDYTVPEVRLVRLNATRTAVVKGQYDGIVAGKVIVVNGQTLESVSSNGAVKTLGHLVKSPSWLGPGTVVLKPDLSQWIYTIADTDTWTSEIHLGSATRDRVIATLPSPSPDGQAFYQPFAWKASGVYMVKQPVGLGGAGPFLDYHFNLATFDLSSNKVSMVSPDCRVYDVLDDGTAICGTSGAGYLEVRSRSGQTKKIQVTIGGPANSTDAFAYFHVSVSPDSGRLIVGRNGAKDPVINYQMAIADLTASSAQAFGPLDYLPDAWLPDGRVIATHICAYVDWGGGPCNASLDGTYIFSADGASYSLFFKLKPGSVVVGYI
jgi:hypothetical protein